MMSEDGFSSAAPATAATPAIIEVIISIEKKMARTCSLGDVIAPPN
jgi:hypothetical protein